MIYQPPFERSDWSECYNHGRNNSYSMVARDLWQRKPPFKSPRASPSDLGQFAAINPWPRAITITNFRVNSKQPFPVWRTTEPDSS